MPGTGSWAGSGGENGCLSDPRSNPFLVSGTLGHKPVYSEASITAPVKRHRIYAKVNLKPGSVQPAITVAFASLFVAMLEFETRTCTFQVSTVVPSNLLNLVFVAYFSLI